MIALPWRVRKRIESAVSACHYFVNRGANARLRPQHDQLKILFCVPFYGYTGGAFAVLSAANLLSDNCDVSFLTRAGNVMNRYVSRGVRMVDAIAGPYDVCVMESGIEEAVIAAARRSGARIIMTMHGAPDTADGSKNHGYSDAQVVDALRAADSIQYVSDVQRPGNSQLCAAGPKDKAQQGRWPGLRHDLAAQECRGRHHGGGIVIGKPH